MEKYIIASLQPGDMKVKKSLWSIDFIGNKVDFCELDGDSHKCISYIVNDSSNSLYLDCSDENRTIRIYQSPIQVVVLEKEFDQQNWIARVYDKESEIIV